MYSQLHLVFWINLLSLCTVQTKGQQLTLDIIKAWATEVDSTTSDQDPLCILNGIMLMPQKVDSALNQYDLLRDKLDIQLLDKSARENTIFHSLRPIILLNETRRQTNKSKQKSLQQALNLFKKPTLKTAHGQLFEITPAVFFNSHQMPNADTHSFLSRLKPHEIEHIIISDSGPMRLFGKNAQNGLIRVWLR